MNGGTDSPMRWRRWMSKRNRPRLRTHARCVPPQVGSIGPVPLDNTDKFQDENCAEHQEINGDQGNTDFQPHWRFPVGGSPRDSG